MNPGVDVERLRVLLGEIAEARRKMNELATLDAEDFLEFE